MNLDELYKLKGKLQTEIEIAQAHLQQINKQIVSILNSKEKKQEEVVAS